MAQFSLVFLAVNLAVSVFTRGDYLFTDVAGTSRGNMPSDVANMSKALFLPYWFWGAVCGLISVAALCVGLWVYLREGKATADVSV
jgi:membrane-associated phospholipid phosphatase